MPVTICNLTTFDQFVQVQALHRIIWGITEGLYPPMLNTAAYNGGIVLGVFDDAKMIGFSFAFLGCHTDGTLKLCSQTTGLLPEYRHQGLGERLKWEQYDRARAFGLQLITWTVDPLEAPNAILNFRKLGSTSHTYQDNVYGEHFSVFGEGLPSDRLTVEWWLNDGRVTRLRRGEATTPLPPSGPIINSFTGQGASRQIAGLDLTLEDPRLLFEIPHDFQAMRRTDMFLALDWRLQMRQAFHTYFERGYQIEDAFVNWENGERRVYYVLKR